MSPKYKNFTIYFLLSLILDQGSKIWARHALRPRHDAMVIIPNFFDLRYAENSGSAFSLLHDLANGRIVFLAFGVIALVVIAQWLKRLPADSRVLAVAIGLITGGALGNIIDRALIGRVTDFIVWKVGIHQWPTFNIADSLLVVGIGMILVHPSPKKSSSTLRV